jgi:acyl-CoA hydrolase
MDLIGVHPVKHSDLGFNNTLFGGKLLYWIDGDAVAYAMEVCDTPRMVTNGHSNNGEMCLAEISWTKSPN